MKIISQQSPIITSGIPDGYDFLDYSFDGDGHYSEFGDDNDFDSAEGKSKEKKTFKSRLKGFGKKVGEAARSLKKFIGNLKPKKGARKLKKRKDKTGKDEHVDVVPEVVATKSARGEDVMVRANPDGTRNEFSKSETVVAPNGKTYAKEDLEKAGKTVVEGGEVVKVIPPADVAVLKTEDGEEIPFRKDDLIDRDTEEGKGMSKGLKTGLIIGGIVVGVGILTFVIYKLTKKGK